MYTFQKKNITHLCELNSREKSPDSINKVALSPERIEELHKIAEQLVQSATPEAIRDVIQTLNLGVDRALETSPLALFEQLDTLRTPSNSSKIADIYTNLSQRMAQIYAYPDSTWSEDINKATASRNKGREDLRQAHQNRLGEDYSHQNV